ncbi:MAG: type II toxin-antitoxin system HicA family toxin [Anaerolineae bacterium]|nr:type II toxin-antitoxin system HicA family toxin [Anaerolineae bacterium]
MSPREKCINALQRAGFSFVRQTGSHTVYHDGEHVVVVPRHPGKIKPGTMKSIIRQAGMSVDEFLELL